MKKLLLILLSAVALTAMAQQKTVAVLNPICRDNSVNGFYQQIVRGAMESAVTASNEYEAYDRSAFDQIQKEQAFQRTGAVSDSQIKQMGEMAGVDYVLVSEVSAYEGYLSAVVKILNVTSGKYDKSRDEIMQLNPEIVKTKCQEMASSLFGNRHTPTSTNTATNTTSTGQKSVSQNNYLMKAAYASASAKKGEYEQAISYYDKAIQIAKVQNALEDVANYQYFIAYYYFMNLKNYVNSRKYAQASIATLQTLGLNKGQGRCYIIIGMCYASTQLYSNDAKGHILNKTVYWAAVDKFVKAKQVDPSVESQANEFISTYSKYFPTKKERSQYPNEFSGSTFYVGGWIGENTYIR